MVLFCFGYFVRDVNDIGTGKELLHPSKSQLAGNRLTRERADEHGEAVAEIPREIDEVQVAGVGRHKASDDHATRGPR